MLTGSEEGSVILWDLDGFKIKQVFALDTNVRGVDKMVISTKFSLDGAGLN